MDKANKMLLKQVLEGLRAMSEITGDGEAEISKELERIDANKEPKKKVSVAVAVKKEETSKKD